MINRPKLKPVNFYKELLPILLVVSASLLLPPIWGIAIVGVMLGTFVLYAILFHTDKLWWSIIFLAPFSLDLDIYFETPIGMYLPTEPLLVIFLLFSLFYLPKRVLDKNFLSHPITILLGLYYVWMFFSVLTSEEVVVSIKRFITHMWYIVPIFLLGSKMMKKRANREKFINYYVIAFSIVVIYTLWHLVILNFPVKESQFVMQPFFKDHTILGAALGLTIPYVYLKLCEQKIGVAKRLLWLVLAISYTIVLFFTYSRAALLSVFIALGLYLLILLRIRFRYLLLGFVFVAGIGFVFQDSILMGLETNKSESSGDLMENLESASNVSSDASNVERINRWNSALDMVKERPFFGWGPGTYQFVYAPFQVSEHQTIISTNFGDVGNAHSEYLSAASESGWPAAIIFIVFVIVTIAIGYETVIQMKRGKDRLVLLAALLGFVTYFSHAVLNNFLDSDKIAIMIWGFVVIIIHYNNDFRKKEIEGYQKKVSI